MTDPKPIVSFDDLSKQQKYRVRLWKAGKCVACTKDRGDSPYLRTCVRCAVKRRKKERKARNYKSKARPGQRGRTPLRPDGSV